MNIEIELALADWAETRKNSKAFINALGEAGLKKSFPRPGLDTYGKHFEEMIDIQSAYVDAIETGVMNFDNTKENEEYTGKSFSSALLSSMESLDRRLVELAHKNGEKLIEWDEDDKKTVVAQIRNLCIHEAMHIGQLVAFSYVTGVKIPESIMESWALSAQEEK
jgi:hypothetical protein